MNGKDHSSDNAATLERLISHVPRDIPPGRDLWPGIEARVRQDQNRPDRHIPWWQSPVLSVASLVIAASALTFALTRPTAPGPAAPAPQPVIAASALDPGFLVNRQRLENQIEDRLSALSPEMQGVVRQNLASIRGSLNAINLALDSDPNDTDLQDLLVSTYERELKILTEIARMPEQSTRRIDL